jgi:hypothetical protein
MEANHHLKRANMATKKPRNTHKHSTTCCERVEGVVIIEDFISLLCQASPLAWCAGQGMLHASEWEQRAVVQIRRATEFLRIVQQQTAIKTLKPRKRSKKTGSICQTV